MTAPLKLADLEPELLVGGKTSGCSYRKTENLEEAQGVWFQSAGAAVGTGLSGLGR